MSNHEPNWLKKFFTKFENKLKKEALDKLPEDELNGVLPGLNPMMDQQQAAPPASPAPEDLPPPEPEVSGNLFEVDINGITFPVRLMPEIVMKDSGNTETAAPGATADPMNDTSLNPNADPIELAKWMSGENTEKPYSQQEAGTVDPLEQEEEGIDVNDVGDEKSLNPKEQIDVHKKTKKQASTELNGSDRSNPYYPCSVCANYDVSNGTCKFGLDVEKVQAAKSCSWLNSNFKPYGEDGKVSNSAINEDKETYNNDISQMPNNSGMGATKAASKKSIKDSLRKI